MIPFGDVFARLREASDALAQAQNIADYQAIGMRCREALLAFVAAAQDVTEWTTEPAPKRADFRAWSELICNTALAGPSQKERRHLLKSSLADVWTFANWLTHAHSATWNDAEAAQATTEHVLGMAASLVIRHVRAVPSNAPTVPRRTCRRRRAGARTYPKSRGSVPCARTVAGPGSLSRL